MLVGKAEAALELLKKVGATVAGGSSKVDTESNPKP